MTYAKQLLRRWDIQQKDVARVLQINTARVSLVLSGKDTASTSEARKLERFFGLPLSILTTDAMESTDEKIDS